MDTKQINEACISDTCYDKDHEKCNDSATRDGVMQTLYYTKHFTSGLMKGFYFKTSLTFHGKDAVERAAAFVKRARLGMRPMPNCGSSAWELVDVSFQNYARN